MGKPAPPRSYGWQGDEERVCAFCDQKVILKGHSIWFRRFPVIETFHMHPSACRRAA